MKTSSESWWHDLYDDLLAEALLVRADPSELDATARFIVDRLELGDHDVVFDQCFGIGSVALELAARGFRVTGVEQATSYVARANAEANRARLEVDLRQGDARTFVSPHPARGAFNWWTSFGYSADDADNAKMLARAFESLAPGGSFLLDTMNLPGVLRSFESETTITRDTPQGRLTLLRRTELDLHAGVMNKRWSYVLPNGETVDKPATSLVRLYLPHTLALLLEGVGFRDVRLYGDVRGGPLEIDSPRCICHARRPR